MMGIWRLEGGGDVVESGVVENPALGELGPHCCLMSQGKAEARARHLCMPVRKVSSTHVICLHAHASGCRATL